MTAKMVLPLLMIAGFLLFLSAFPTHYPIELKAILVYGMLMIGVGVFVKSFD